MLTCYYHWLTQLTFVHIKQYRGRELYIKVRGSGAGGYEEYRKGDVWSYTVFAFLLGIMN